ncbi:hypothetical protein Bca52824_062652 [Brassica carinata]|uniref:DUF1985 domain-containing protein n=1 Tax=Brassica carinata TaxID=52824 RepID=A0A8X7U6Y4_BRACI|nr:hypothetical protein Bca52824_062652 [Brassica carinata]
MTGRANEVSFSGSFDQSMVVRILRVLKKFEICFLFAGRPLRMSLHDFVQVTCLNCSKIPKKNIRRKKNPITEKPYWGGLIAGRVHPMNSSSKVKFPLHIFLRCGSSSCSPVSTM